MAESFPVLVTATPVGTWQHPVVLKEAVLLAALVEAEHTDDTLTLYPEQAVSPERR